MTPPPSEQCPVCHFEWDSISPSEVTPRINRAVGQFATVLLAGGEAVTKRPEAQRWSTLEYGAHLRDVMLLVRDRLILTVVEDTPTPFPLYREERVGLRLYENEEPRLVASDLEVAARLFTSAFDALRHEYLERTLMYGYPSPAQRSLGWTAAQVLHECEHHLDDVRANAAVLATS